MVAWGTVVSLMCLVKSYQGLVMYVIHFIHLFLCSFKQRSCVPWIS